MVVRIGLGGIFTYFWAGAVRRNCVASVRHARVADAQCRSASSPESMRSPFLRIMRRAHLWLTGVPPNCISRPYPSLAVASFVLVIDSADPGLQGALLVGADSLGIGRACCVIGPRPAIRLSYMVMLQPRIQTRLVGPADLFDVSESKFFDTRPLCLVGRSLLAKFALCWRHLVRWRCTVTFSFIMDAPFSLSGELAGGLDRAWARPRLVRIAIDRSELMAGELFAILTRHHLQVELRAVYAALEPQPVDTLVVAHAGTELLLGHRPALNQQLCAASPAKKFWTTSSSNPYSFIKLLEVHPLPGGSSVAHS